MPEATPSVKTSIAIADAQILAREILVKLIDATGLYNTIASASTGAELLSMIESSAMPPEICIIDIAMPGLDGYETIKRLRMVSPSTRVLFITMFINEYAVIKMIQAGANGYLMRGCNPTEFMQALAEVTTTGFYSSSGMKPDTVRLVKRGKLKIPNLTVREKQFLLFNCYGLEYKQIAQKMGISIKTINTYRETLCAKLRVANRIGLAMFAIDTSMYRLD